MVTLIYFGFVLTIFGFANYRGWRMRLHRHYTNTCQPPHISTTDICFTAEELSLSRADLHRMLGKRFPYYSRLKAKEQRRFLSRLRSFMQRRQFIIKDDEGVREMPVLVCAAAVQLCFGLRDYGLRFYKHIRIYPEEYVAAHNFSVLAGNVQGNTISVAWNHLLNGYGNPEDGANIGLHEMSHALYIQQMVIGQDYARRFAQQYHALMKACHHAFKTEAAGHQDLYTSYADTNLQEFWAETVEIFFEKPVALQQAYPEVYERMVRLLNQDPRLETEPVLTRPLSLYEEFDRIWS